MNPMDRIAALFREAAAKNSGGCTCTCHVPPQARCPRGCQEDSTCRAYLPDLSNQVRRLPSQAFDELTYYDESDSDWLSKKIGQRPVVPESRMTHSALAAHFTYLLTSPPAAEPATNEETPMNEVQGKKIKGAIATLRSEVNEEADRIMGKLTEIEAMVNAATTAGEGTGVDGGANGEPTADPDAGAAPVPSAGQWHPNGWSIYADEEGLVESSVVTPLYRRLPRSVQAKIGYLCVCFESYFSASYPNAMAQTFAQQHLSSRRTVIVMDDHSQVWEVARYEVTTKKPDKPNYDVPPWAQETSTWKQVEVRFDAYAMDWDPAKDHAYFVKFWKERARAELEAQGFKPSNFGL